MHFLSSYTMLGIPGVGSYLSAYQECILCMLSSIDTTMFVGGATKPQQLAI